MSTSRTIWTRLVCAAAFAIITFAQPGTAAAQDTMCDPSFEDCRSRLLELIRNETVGIDVAFWFMEDARYSNEIVRRHQAGVPVRVLVDPRANPTYAGNAGILQQLRDAGIPMRKNVSSGILHWKMMLFDGQNTVEFSAANYSPWAFRPNNPYVDYTDEAIMFTSDPAVVNSFRTQYDNLWTNTSRYANYANITTPLARRYATFTKDAALNFPPAESFRSRAVSRYDAEREGIDVIMYRITDKSHSDAMIRAVQRGVPVRLYTEQEQYRDPARYWHSWNVDRMYAAGVQIRHRAHAGLNHQKTVLLRSQQMVIWGSSNWTSPSSSSQEEHNYFTTKPALYSWFTAQFDRKWDNTQGFAETEPFRPLPPGRPSLQMPADLSSAMPLQGVVLRWTADLWAHEYDVYFGTTPDPPLLQANLPLGPTEDIDDVKQFALPALEPGRTYFWRIGAKTMANQVAFSAVRSFTTEGTAPPPPPTGTPGEGDVVLYAAEAPVVVGRWSAVNDQTAAGGARLANADAGAAKVTAPRAEPADYFEMTFNAVAGVPYRLWIRGAAQNNSWSNDSLFIQFSGTVNTSGAPVWRIGTTSATEYNLEDCGGCGLAGWGWQDNGWGVGVLGPEVVFDTTGPQTLRIQPREDGFSIDQIVLSPSTFLRTAPGALKTDATILAKAGGTVPSDGGGGDEEPPPDEDEENPPPASSAGEVILHAGRATTYAGGWLTVEDVTGAGGLAITHPDAGAAKLAGPLASPTHYFEMTFNAEAGRAYRLWIRSKADRNSWANDSLFIQFSDSVDQAGQPRYRIGSTSAVEYNLEDCSGCGLNGWGWQDNGWGVGQLGPEIRFGTTGPQTIRIQTREDGLTIDQIVLSPTAFITTAPGVLKLDTTILPQSGG